MKLQKKKDTQKLQIDRGNTSSTKKLTPMERQDSRKKGSNNQGGRVPVFSKRNEAKERKSDAKKTDIKIDGKVVDPNDE